LLERCEASFEFVLVVITSVAVIEYDSPEWRSVGVVPHFVGIGEVLCDSSTEGRACELIWKVIRHGGANVGAGGGGGEWGDIRIST
jgi:hypothetical protein